MIARLTFGMALAGAALLGQVKLPPYTRQVLANGVAVDLMPRPGVPLVGFRIMVKGGGEPDGVPRTSFRRNWTFWAARFSRSRALGFRPRPPSRPNS
jgi:hypothetical protein